MSYSGNALFGPFVAGTAKRIGIDIAIPSGRVLVREPAVVTRRKRTFERSNSLKRLVGGCPPDEERNRLIRSEATGEQVSRRAGSIASAMLWQVHLEQRLD